MNWDGNLLPDVLSKENVERVAVLNSCGDEEQLIGVPQLENGTGITQAKAVFSAVEQWGSVEKIQAMCFDSTAVNSGRLNGSGVLLTKLLEKNILFLACRHYMIENNLKSVFDLKMAQLLAATQIFSKSFRLDGRS